jgi:sec-independent protein translocase protein TatC
MDSTLQTFIREYEPYLSDFRRRVIFTATFFLLIFVFGIVVSPYMIASLVTLLNFTSVQYVVLSPFQLLATSMNIGFFLAIVCSAPLILVEAYEFLSSAFTRHERRLFFRYFVLAGLLFLIGFIYSGVVLYYAAFVVATYNHSLGLANVWDIDLFISQSLLTSAFLGILFEYPLVLALLIRFGILKHQMLVQGRLYAMCATAIVVGLLPPSDIVSLVVMALPLLGLYELTLLFTHEKKRQVVSTFTPLRSL